MFDLDPRLAADTIPVTDWPLCRVLLMNESTYPWLILVPRRRGVSELHEIDPSDRAILVEEMAEASHRFQNLTGARKMNVAALGNVVAQFHVHVVARFEHDPVWPRPVWGLAPPCPYEPAAHEAFLERIRAVF